MDCISFDFVGFTAQGQSQSSTKILLISSLLWAVCCPLLALGEHSLSSSSVHVLESSPALALQSSLSSDVSLLDDSIIQAVGTAYFSNVDSSIESAGIPAAAKFQDTASLGITLTSELLEELFLQSSQKGLLLPTSVSYIDSFAVTPRWLTHDQVYESGELLTYERTSTTFNTATVADILSDTASSAHRIESLYGLPMFSSLLLPQTPSNSKTDHVATTSASEMITTAGDSFVGFLSSQMSMQWTSKHLDINATVVVSSPSEQMTSSAAGEITASDWPSSAELITSTFPAGNSSCSQNGDNCGEGVDEGLDDGMRLKIIIGVVCGSAALVLLLVVLIGFVFRRRGKMSSGSKIDLSSYWDDSVTLSYINGHADLPKDNADEMISLDNDSFLNSLDSMSFTNMWTTDNAKHTNF